MRPRSIRFRIQSAYQPRNVMLFSVGAVALGFAGGAAQELLRMAFHGFLGWSYTLTYAIMLGLGIALLPAVALTFPAFRTWLSTRRNEPRFGAVDASRAIESKRALIAFVSNHGTSHEIALKRHASTLEYLWLMHSEASVSTERAHSAWSDQNEQRPLQGGGPQLMEYSGLSQVTLANVRAAIGVARSAGISPSDIVVDITGFPGNHAAAAVVACLEGAAVLEYIQGQRDENTGEVINPRESQPVRIDLEPHHGLALVPVDDMVRGTYGSG